MTTVSLGVMKKLSSDERKRGKVIRLNVNMKAELKVETLEMVEEEPSGVSLDDAGVVVAGGWGLCSVGGFQPVEKLAKILGGVVAGTRPAVDYGWIPKHSMIGQSGRAVSPRLFISIGASGAPQFTSGFTGARVVMAIDQNTNAPIFEATDIGLVGDLLEILPCLVAELEESPLHV